MFSTWIRLIKEVHENLTLEFVWPRLSLLPTTFAAGLWISL